MNSYDIMSQACDLSASRIDKEFSRHAVLSSMVRRGPISPALPIKLDGHFGASVDDKNDPSRFLGEGITFKAKLIGILEVSEARGDKMCQDALNDLKTAIRAAGEHKQRITISIAIDGLRLRDEKTGDCLYHHPVHKISFIAQDMSDSRAFGYIFGSPDTGHRFFGIKTDKTASQVVISMRDLFQVVFELKKREIEMAKNTSDSHFVKLATTSLLDSVHFTKEELEKTKAKYANVLKSRCAASKSSESNISEYKGSTSEAIADLLDLEHELNSIQQGINQMDKITPSDPFGPLSKGELYIDPFDDSFSSKTDKPLESKVSAKTHASTYHLDEQPDHEKQSFLPTSTSTSKTFFSQFSPGIGKTKAEDGEWFDQETESLFNETVNVNNLEPTSSPVALNAPATEPVQAEEKKSPVKTDLFTELDPLGTGRVKPYVDKKDFFQELKNPPKKVLKELLGENSISESACFFSPTVKEENKTPSTAKSDSAFSTSTIDSIQGLRENSSTPKYIKIDPFEDGDPFDKTDPFQGETFSVGEFPPLFNTKPSMDGLFDDKSSWKFDASNPSEDKSKNPASTLSLFSTGALRVSLPPEKSSGSPTNKLNTPSNSPEDSKSLRRRNYQTLKQSSVEGTEDSIINEETFFCTKVTLGNKEKFPFKEKFRSLQSPPSFRTDSSRTYASLDVQEPPSTPDPPPRNKTALFSIKPPPLPPKKANQLLKPPARPPSIESSAFQYDYLEKKENPKEELKCVKLKKQLFVGKTSPPASELKKQNSNSEFPVLLPPPNRKASTETGRITTSRKTEKTKAASDTPGSILNLKLNQLDNTGLENLAITLGVPSENIYSMTLQELTKMLAGKYLTNTETKSEEPKSDAFEVDFDANFAKMEINSTPPPPSYDKYAVFKELIENENKTQETPQNVNVNENLQAEEPEVVKENSTGPMEDKYAALRQLSLKPETLSEDLDDEGVVKRPSSVSDVNPSLDDFPSVTNILAPDVSNAKPSWTLESRNDISEVSEASERRKSVKQETPKFPSESPLFPLVDEFSDDRKLSSPRNNWATFEKTDFEEPSDKKSEAFNENENSPFSSDGKEYGDFHWYEKNYRKRTRKEVPWKDDDESWDDNSPKESFCSDESSREERSPDGGRVERYEKWNLCKKPPKTERKWNEKGIYWSQRGVWQEETEDEFEETWRKREKLYGADRKPNIWHGACDNYSKRYEWCNSRDEPWDEDERRAFCYGSRRKRSESETEFRKRCDSDVSDKECVWSSQKSYPDSLGRSGKQKQYYSSTHSYRECSDHCHESRSKHRKGTTQKRPSSASDSKRNFEKLYSPGEYSYRSSEKTYVGKADKDEYKYQYCKDHRHRADEEHLHYYKSYNWKASGHHAKSGSRSNRGSSSGQSDVYSSFGKRPQADFGSFEPLEENNYKHGKSASPSRFQFDSEAENFEKTRKSEQSSIEFQKTSDRPGNEWASTNGKTDEKNGFFGTRNNNEGFASFKEELKTSPKSSKENGKQERGPEATKPQMKSKPHLPILGRQESSTSLRKSDSINIFSRENDPFEGDDFFSSAS